MKIIVIFLLLWFLVSVVVGLLVGRFLRRKDSITPGTSHHEWTNDGILQPMNNTRYLWEIRDTIVSHPNLKPDQKKKLIAALGNLIKAS